MIECRLIWPVSNNSGFTLVEQHRRLQRDLVRLFGGYIKTHGIHNWQDTADIVQEEVLIYDIAIDSSEADELRNLAKDLLTISDQVNISLRIDREVMIIT